jgi:spermidine synthase
MRALFGLIFAASGAAALIYEVTWTRLLTLQLGHGIAAASTVLAAFMGGLAIGSAAGGHLGAKLSPTSALRWYAALELAIAALAIVLPFELAALDPLLAAAYADGNGGTTFALLRFITSLLLLALPAAAMGATFPIASRWFVQSAGAAARDAGTLYATNTIGAALGALTAGFVLLPFMGLYGATAIAVVLNVAAAGGAYLLSNREIPEPVTAGAPAPPPKRRRPGKTATPTRMVHSLAVAAVALGMSGFASLTLQVIWTRLLALILGPTTYAFSIIVSVFITGLAVGAALSSRIATRVRQPIIGLSVCLALSVGLAAASASLVDRGLLSIAEVVSQPNVQFSDVLLRQALLALALLAPMTVAFGAAFPFAVAAATRRDETVAADLGLIYAVNTTGAIAGALLAGFVFIPAAGLHGSLRIVTALGAVGALTLLWIGRTSGRARVGAAALALSVLALGLWLPQWDRLLLSSGAYKYAAALQGPDVRTSLTAGELLYYREGASATVAVRRSAGTTSMAIDGKVDASNGGDMLTQRLLAHVPLLLHDDPKRVAIIGLGSGVTLGSALAHPTVERADVLEISSAVVEASRYFEAENRGAIKDPRTRLIIGDGRTHLALSREQYDVIVSEPSNPWMAGIASLFTREFFEAAKARLRPGGVLCQWAHTYDISTRDLQSIVATFLSVFPEGTLWLVGDGDVLLIGSNEPMEPKLQRTHTTWHRPGVRADLESVNVTSPNHILSQYISGGADLARWAGNAPIQSDNRAALEFSGPQSIFGSSEADNAMLLRELASQHTPPPIVAAARNTSNAEEIRERGLMMLRADAYRPAYDDFVRALEQDPRDPEALNGLIRAAAPLRRMQDARTLLTRLADSPTHISTKLALSRLLASEGQYDQAAAIPFGIIQADPDNVAALEQLASILSDLGDVERLRPVVARLRTVAPGTEASHYYSASLLFMEQRHALAATEARRAIALNPSHARAHNLLGAALASLGQPEQARTAFEASLEADPRDPATYTNLATLELQAGRRELAHRYYAEALTIDPTNGPARQGLAQVDHPK